MSFNRTQDILDYTRKFHRDLGALLAKLSDEAAKEKVKILLTYMSRHEEHMAECLGEFEKDSSKRLMDAWFKFTPEMPQCRCFEKAELSPDMPVDQIVETVRGIDQCLLKIYREMAEKAHTPECRELFNRLLEMEQKESIQRVGRSLSFIEEN